MTLLCQNSITEPGAVATGCDHSTGKSMPFVIYLQALRLALASGPWVNGWCASVASTQGRTLLGDQSRALCPRSIYRTCYSCRTNLPSIDRARHRSCVTSPEVARGANFQCPLRPLLTFPRIPADFQDLVEIP